MLNHSVLVLLGLTSGLLSACVSSGAATRQEPDCIVQQVVDGDTFRCGDGQRIRLIGIDSPERQQQPFGRKAQEALQRMAPPGTSVRLERDVAPNDRYGRVLAYAWLGSTLVNEAMVQGGWAVLFTVPPNVKYAERLERAQKEARARNAGLWADRGFDCSPVNFRRRACLNSP